MLYSRYIEHYTLLLRYIVRLCACHFPVKGYLTLLNFHIAAILFFSSLFAARTTALTVAPVNKKAYS